MSWNLHHHPFGVTAHFTSSLVLTFAVPSSMLEEKVPSGLRLDTFDGQWAFLAVAVVQTRKLRPAGFPAFLGQDFILIGYRIFVRYHTSAGRELRGLYILRSVTDSRIMKWLGNRLTLYKYEQDKIRYQQQQHNILIRSESDDLLIHADDRDGATLPAGSPFRDWKEARRFAGPLPFTFTPVRDENKMLIIEGVRQNWTPSPVRVIDYRVSFPNNVDKLNPVLANAFIIRNVAYHWNKGWLDPITQI